jgi:lipid-A-disaccharide synthase
MAKNILVIAGELSGDIHASSLIKNLKNINPDLRFLGIGGDLMKEEGVELLYNIDNLSIIGVWEIIAKLKYVREAYKKVCSEVKKNRPVAAILVDYPGFNLTLAKYLKKHKIPVIYYITPQVWAWGKSRIKTIKRTVSKALVIFKFEEDLFKQYGINSTFIGHPLMDKDEVLNIPDKKNIGLEDGKITIALLPGSRESEVKRLLPIMIKTAEILSKKLNVQFLLLKSSGIDDNLYNKLSKNSRIKLYSIKDNSYGCLGVSDFVFTSSGTATLECAIMEKPMLITYKTSFLTAILFKLFAKTKFIGLVNIIAKKEVSPEILQYNAKPVILANKIFSILSSENKKEKQIEALKEVKKTLGARGAAKRAAEIINDFITKL